MSSQSNRGHALLNLPSVNGGTRVVGVFGYPVEHSLSPAMHNAAFAALGLPYIYVPFSVAPGDLRGAINSLISLGIAGVNLTIPHKESALPFLHEITDEAREVGAVNTVHNVDRRLVGDNTDGYGFYAPLAEAGWSASGSRALILGAGGAARSVVFRLAREGASMVLANRSPERAVRLADTLSRAGYPTPTVVELTNAAGMADAVRSANIIVNTTRVGMHPNHDERPSIPYAGLSPGQWVYDLVYNPVETAFIKEARRRGCTVMTGVKMLVYQGAAAFKIWTGTWPPTDVMETSVLNNLG